MRFRVRKGLARAEIMVRMYVPTHFAATDADVEALLASMAAVDLISPTQDGLVATFLPMIYDPGAGSLLGHVARSNTHWSEASGESMVIVKGPDAYISPSWYAAKREHGRVVPTWNYVTAHVYGPLLVHDDVAWLRSLVTRLTSQYEAAQPAPWAITDAPEKFIDGMLRAIVGVELKITRIEAKVKLGQNRSVADQDGMITGLGEDPLAETMREHRRVPDDLGVFGVIAPKNPRSSGG
jgi:transcriptional regulator